MQNNTTDALTMTIHYKHIVTQTYFQNGLTRHDQHCNQSRKQETDRKEKINSPRFAFLKISATTHLAHTAFPSLNAPTQKSEKSQIFQPDIRKSFYDFHNKIHTLAFHALLP